MIEIVHSCGDSDHTSSAAGKRLAVKVDGRRELLRELVLRNGYQSVRTLAEELECSPSTIRRDLADLEAAGLLHRTHGGALPRGVYSTAHEPTLLEKQRLMVAEKRRIGKAAAELVHPGETVILDSGSTTWQVGQALKATLPLTIVTNDIKILSHLANIEGLSLISPGGNLRANVYTLLGSETARFLEGLRVNWTFLGADAVDLEHGITNVNLDEVPVKQAMIRAAHRTVVVTDHTKFGRAVFARVCGLDEVDLIVTDDGLSATMADAMRKMRLEVLTAGAQEGDLRSRGGAKPEQIETLDERR